MKRFKNELRNTRHSRSKRCNLDTQLVMLYSIGPVLGFFKFIVAGSLGNRCLITKPDKAHLVKLMEKFGLGPYKGQPNFTHLFQGFLKLQVNYLVAKNHPKKMEGWCGMGLGLLGLFLLILRRYSPYKQIPQALIIIIPILREELNQRESLRKIERKFSRIIS